VALLMLTLSLVQRPPSPQEMQLFKDRGVKMVDTTCPWVAKVWNSVDQHSRKSYTSVIHGKYSHEETIATASFADTYVIVRDLAEAQMVVDYILNGGDREAFLKHFEKAVSKGFDPDRDLVRVGLANQVRAGAALVQKLFNVCLVGSAARARCCC
jgi:4-hydroxy-3-methylbut-2-enyl diphosphate reductase